MTPFLKYLKEHGKLVRTDKFLHREYSLVERHPEDKDFILIGTTKDVFERFVYMNPKTGETFDETHYELELN